MNVTRVFPNADPFLDNRTPAFDTARWIGPAVHDFKPIVFALRCKVNVTDTIKTRLHVSGDERYELYVDGQRVGRGSERGDLGNWFFESYELVLTPGEHVLVARVHWLGGLAPYAQFTHRPGFLLLAEGALAGQLTTGVGPWEFKALAGYSFSIRKRGQEFMSVGSNVGIDGGAFAWGFERGEGAGWSAAPVVGNSAVFPHFAEQPTGWKLRPALLPAMLDRPTRAGTARHVQDTPAVSKDVLEASVVRQAEHLANEADAWQRLINGHESLTIPPFTRRRVIVDLEQYFCAYPQLVVTGGAGATFRVSWSEALYSHDAASPKGTYQVRFKYNRNEIEGKCFLGVGDTFQPDGGAQRMFEPLWWQAGRYVELAVETGAHALTLDAFSFLETRYPYDLRAEFTSSDARLSDDVAPVALRTLEMCSHESYMDCPYYEQLMYVGDTRLEVLTTFVTTPDDRLPRKAVLLFDLSRWSLPNGLATSRYPSRITQSIPPFSLWWVAMVHDRAMWRGDLAFVRLLMPGVRAVLDAFVRTINAEGLIQAPPGWNFVDWVPGWERGVPPGGVAGVNGSINFHAAWVFKQAAELETFVGEPELAARAARYAGSIGQASNQTFWDESRGLYSEDAGHTAFSEHTQCLALLGQNVDTTRHSRVVQGLMSATDLARTTIYFTHYLFETFRLLGRMDKLFERLELWFNLKTLGFKTAFESPEPSRSDCHAWSAHPVFHYFATFLGVRPATFGFETVTITPQFGPLKWMRGSLPHPRGELSVDAKHDAGKLTGTITLPPGVSGTLVWNGATQNLLPGEQPISLRA